jgi:hypothetical protein
VKNEDRRGVRRDQWSLRDNASKAENRPHLVVVKGEWYAVEDEKE